MRLSPDTEVAVLDILVQSSCNNDTLRREPRENVGSGESLRKIKLQKRGEPKAPPKLSKNKTDSGHSISSILRVRNLSQT